VRPTHRIHTRVMSQPRFLNKTTDEGIKNVIAQQLQIYKQNLQSEITVRESLINAPAKFQEEDTTQIEEAIAELKKDRMRDQHKLYELESALKYLEVQCHYSGELYASNPENRVLEDEEIKIKETADGILSRLNEKLMAISAKWELLLEK
jgi:hypothetical protein